MFEYLIVIGILSGQEGSETVGCRLIPDDAERLACYDSIFGRPSGDVAVPDSAETPREIAPVAGSKGSGTPSAAATSPTSAAQDFGLTEEQRIRRKDDAAPATEMIESHVAAVERRARDRFLLTLENGQKWTLVEPTPIQRFYAGDAITIRKAAFNSYLASGPNSGTTIRVRRVH